MKLDRRLTAKKLQPATARFLDLTARKIYDLDRKWDPARERQSSRGRGVIQRVVGRSGRRAFNTAVPFCSMT